MLVSIHVPKAAGNSFRVSLEASFGQRLMGDYGDWAGFNTPEANQRRAARTAAMRSRRDELLEKYDVIHGHFIADKYLGLFPRADFIAFFREPCQQVLAHYYFLVRNPQREHPEEKVLHENKMTLMDYLRWDAFRDHQTQFLGSLSIEDLSMVGLSCQYRRSLAHFKEIFGLDLGEERHCNVNADRDCAQYEVSAEVRKAVKKHREADIALYRRAQELFERQASRVGVSFFSMPSGGAARR